MRLLFWKAKKQSTPNQVNTTRRVVSGQRPNQTQNVQARSTNAISPTQMTVTRSAKVVEMKRNTIPENAKKVMPLKAWCDVNLNPLAWSRIVIRMLPVFRDFNKNLSEMQRPTSQTFVENSLYMLMLATIQEIYDVEPKFVRSNPSKVG